MPVTLPPLSRREFLKRSLLAGAVAAFAPGALAQLADKPRDPHFFAFFSDTHIAANPAEKYLGVNMLDHLHACIGELAAWPVSPAAVHVNGDLAYLWGKPGDYERFREGIAPVRAVAPLHLSFGNHDEREHFWSAFPTDAAAQKGALQRQADIFPYERANWFMLDSLDVTDKTPGEVGTAQLDWLGRELDARADKPAIVLVHHNPQFGKVTTGLKDTADLMAKLEPRRQVKAVIFGHTHNWHISQHASGIHLINLPPTSYPFIDGRPVGWVRVTLATDSAEFELRSLDPKHPEHAKVQVLKWREG